MIVIYNAKVKLYVEEGTTLSHIASYLTLCDLLKKNEI